FDVRAGEIVGFAGLVGAGRSEVAKAIFGLDRAATGIAELNGEASELGSIRDAMRRGVGLVPEDRKRQGLVLQMSGRANISMSMLDRLKQFVGLLKFGEEKRQAQKFYDLLRVRAPSIETPVAAMSGGNQQKVALAKLLGARAKVALLAHT